MAHHRYLTLPEAAAEMGLSIAYLEMLEREGMIAVKRTLDDVVVISSADLERARVSALLTEELEVNLAGAEVAGADVDASATDRGSTRAPAAAHRAGAAELDLTAAVPGVRSRADDDRDSSSSLVPFDPLQRYLAEIRRYPLLTREEEHDLAVRFQREGDVAAAYRLVTGNLRLVVMIAREYQRSFRALLDLIQEGNIGLMEAVKKFDPYRGIRFPSYAVWWIRAYIIRYLMNNFRMVKVGTTQAQRRLFFNLQKEKQRIEREGFEITPKLIARRL